MAICPEDENTFEVLLKKADTAMYQAKKMGGNRCARYSDDGIHQVLPEYHEAVNTEEKGRRILRGHLAISICL